MSALGLDSLLGRVADGLDPRPDPWASDPIGWIHEELHEETWSKQDDILRSVVENKKTAVRSAHSTGKSHIAARVIAHWEETHPVDQTFIVTTAPSTNQVRGILWRYLKAIKRKAGLPGYITDGEVPEWKVDGRLIGWGRKPADLKSPEEAATVFQGIHDKYLLVVVDEAGGIPNWLWNAIMSLATQPTNRVLAIGNPDNPSSHFEKICRPDSDWNKIKISAFDSPNFTGEAVSQDLLDALVGPSWVDEARRAWGEESPFYIAKVLAEFPQSSEDALIRMEWIMNAIQRDFSGTTIADFGRYILDPSSSGKDESAYARWRGGQFRIVKTKRGISDTMEQVGWMSRDHRQHPRARFVVDADGLGKPIYDRARELGIPVAPFYAGRRAFKPKEFVNRRSEQWWALRELMEDGLVDIDPKDEVLHAQLSNIRWTMDSTGRIRVETKDEMAERGFPSPDRGDTLMMATAPDDMLLTEPADPVREALEEDEFASITGDLLERPM